MSGMLAEQLRAIIEGPLGTDSVTGKTISERVALIRQNERRHVFGVVVGRDGDDNYFANDESTVLTRHQVIESVKADLEAHGRLLDEKLDMRALAMGDQQKAVDDAEAKIGETFKKVAKRYVTALDKLTGAKWRVVSASESIFSLDSDESPKRAIDIYWEYDPGSMTATVFVEGPKGKQKAYSKQKMSDIPRKNYIEWLSGVLKEDMDAIIALALDEEEVPVVTEEVNERQLLIEEVMGIVGAATGQSGEPKVVLSVGKLFEQLVGNLTHDGDLGDLEEMVKALRLEGVPEKHIHYTVKYKEIPYVYRFDEASGSSWWKAVFGDGRVFFKASSSSHAYSVAKKWGQQNDMGVPSVVKKTEKPKALDQKGAFVQDKALGVYVEQ